jgi:hypothetical protein
LNFRADGIDGGKDCVGFCDRLIYGCPWDDHMASRFVGGIVDHVPNEVHARKFDPPQKQKKDKRQDDRKLNGVCTPMDRAMFGWETHHIITLKEGSAIASQYRETRQ